MVVDSSTILPSYFEKYGRKEPVGPNHSPVCFFEGQPEKTFFELVSQDIERTKIFMRAMLMFGHVPTTGMYNLSWVIKRAALDPQRQVWVDVGGSNGHSLKLFLEENPLLPPTQCVVQDLPEVVESAKLAGDKGLEGVQFLPLNFHTETPVKGLSSCLILCTCRENGGRGMRSANQKMQER